MDQVNSGQPIDILLANLEFLHDYLKDLARKLEGIGQGEEAEIVAGWASVPIEAADAIDALLTQRSADATR